MLKTVIVDDDVMTLQGLTKAVNWKRLNMQIVGTAQNGKDGLDMIESNKPDIIITDIYMPVMNGIDMLKMLRQQNNEAEVIILSGYEDFQYAQSAFKLNVRDYLSKPVTIEEIEAVLVETAAKVTEQSRVEKEEKELRELLEINLPLTQKQWFKQLLEPGHTEFPHLRKVMEQLRIDLDNRNFSVVMIEYMKGREWFDVKPGEWSLSCAVSRIVDELVQAKSGIYVADIQMHLITLIVSEPKPAKKETLEKHARKIADELLSEIERQLKVHVWAAIGVPVDSMEQITLSYKDALILLEERHRLKDKRVITKEDVSPGQRAVPYRPMEHYHAIAEAAVQGQDELVLEKVEAFTATLNSMTHIGIGVLREIAIDFMGVLAVALYDQGLTIEDVDADFNAYKELEKICSKNDLTQWMKGILMSVCHLTMKRVSSKHKKTIDFIIRYVQSHYAEDVTLDHIADKVFLTRNYLSQIFKQSTGENYNNYLTRIRMVKAKELMLTGNYKLYEISQMVGYKNNAYFSQLFKKSTGHSPSEFNL